MIVAAKPRSVKPECHNREPFAAERVLYGLDPKTGFLTTTIIPNNLSPGCKTWDGVGIGQPAPGFPSGTPYPMAHGFDCRGCVHLPEEFRDLA